MTFLQLAGFRLRRSNKNLLQYVSQPCMTPAVIAHIGSQFYQEMPQLTPSVWKNDGGGQE